MVYLFYHIEALFIKESIIMATTKKRKDTNGRILQKGESQRNDGIYMYRWTDANKKRQVIYAPNLDKLREEKGKIQLNSMIGVNINDIKLNEQIERYLATKTSLKQSTLSNYIFYFHHSIEQSAIGKMKIKDIKKSDILLFYSQLHANGFTAGTIKILQKIIRPALQLAVDDDLIRKNPADGCMKEYTESKEKKFALTIEEEQEFFERLLSCRCRKKLYNLFAIMLRTGLRISEALGLTWDDIDFKNRTININHQLQYRTINRKAKYYIDTPKTKAGNRIIPMSDEVYALFLSQRKYWMSLDKDPDFTLDGYKNFVFTSYRTGRCLFPQGVRKCMREVVEMNAERKIQLPPITPHILRHTACSRMAEAGYDIKVVQYILGQTDIRVTMQVYNHVNAERIKKQVQNVAVEYTPINCTTVPILYQTSEKMSDVM